MLTESALPAVALHPAAPPLILPRNFKSPGTTFTTVWFKSAPMLEHVGVEASCLGSAKAVMHQAGGAQVTPSSRPPGSKMLFSLVFSPSGEEPRTTSLR